MPGGGRCTLLIIGVLKGGLDGPSSFVGVKLFDGGVDGATITLSDCIFDVFCSEDISFVRVSAEPGDNESTSCNFSIAEDTSSLFLTRFRSRLDFRVGDIR